MHAFIAPIAVPVKQACQATFRHLIPTPRYLPASKQHCNRQKVNPEADNLANKTADTKNNRGSLPSPILARYKRKKNPSLCKL